jgi:thioredoxin
MTKFFTFLLVMVALISCESNNAQTQSKTIPTIEYQQLLTETKNNQLVDVRTEGEFMEEHLHNAVNINFNANDFEAKIKKLDKNKPTFIYCLSGGRSGSAMEIFTKNGFKQVYNMQGGILQWKGDQLPLTGAEENPSWKGMSKEEFEKITNGDIPVLVDFNATWCGPCKKLKPILVEIEKEYAGKIKVVAIDVDENKSLAESMKVTNIPLLIYYKKGKVEMNIEGFADKARLVSAMKLK